MNPDRTETVAAYALIAMPLVGLATQTLGPYPMAAIMGVWLFVWYVVRTVALAILREGP